MAIIIPSKKTYERQNPKVRDNVIERIEVRAKEVVPDNEYETAVHNESYSNVFQQNELQTDRKAVADGYGQIMYESYIEATPTHAFINKINIPIQYNEFSIIEKILTGENKNKESNIKFSIVGNFYKGTATQTVTVDNTPSSTGNTYGEIIYSTPTEKEEGIRYEFPKTIEKTASSGNGLYEATAKVEIKDLTNLKSVSVEKKDSSFAIKNIYILSGVSFVSLKSIHSFPVETGGSIYSYTREGEYEQYIPTEIEITIYGNTIGIELTDNTVYIKGQTAKKVQSIDGNELMQTSNFWAETGGNAIERAFSATQQEYANGKETATIRCSIGEYYGDKEFSVRFGGELNSYEDMAFYELFVSGDQKLAEGDILYFKNHAVEITEVDEDYYVVLGKKDILSMYKGQSAIAKQLKISTKEKGVPMLFSEYDQVIPMKLGADGKDHPMSVYRDGTPKVFNVLSVHPYFDGAVWQELELQEIMKKV